MKKSVISSLILISGIAMAALLWHWGKQAVPADRNGAAGKLELTWFVHSASGSRPPEREADYVRKTIEKKFDVALNLHVFHSAAEYEAKIISLLHANNPPDFWIDLSADGASKHALNGVLADMTEYITPAAMPNYFKYWVSERDLKLYQLHNRFFRAPVPYDKNVYRSYYIRNDWLKRLGLKMPETYEEYVEVLHAFTYRDPDGNGIPDTFGFTSSGNSVSLSLDWPEYVKNGLLYPAFMENNQLIDMQSDLRVGQVVDDILKLMNDGLADPDWFLNQGSEHLDKAALGKAGVVLGQTADFALDANSQSIQNRTQANDPNADWMPFNPFGDQPLQTGIDPGYPFVFSRKVWDVEPEKIKKSVEILDWLAGEEGFLLTHYGQEGNSYVRSGNTVTLVPGGEAQARARGWTFFTPGTPAVFGLQVIDPGLSERDKSILHFLSTIPVKERLGTTLNPPLGIDVLPFRSKQNELQAKMMFLDKSGARWAEYREIIMSQYNGELILRNFENQIRNARGTKLE